MSAAYRALIAEGDRWLMQADDTFRGGGDYAIATAQAAIATAHFARAALDKPDTLASLIQQGGIERARQNRAAMTDPDAAERAASMERHPAGSKLPAADPNQEGPT